MILGISAHHDDLAIGAGGYLLRAAQRDEIAIVVLADQYLVGGSATRLDALRQVADHRHWQLSILDYRDCNIAVSLEAALRVGRLIQEFDPETLIVPAPGRHIDHAATHLLVKHALRLTEQSRPFYLCDAYKGLLASTDFLYYDDTSAVIEEKVALVDLLAEGQHARDLTQYVRALGIVRGLEANTASAEAFALVAPGGTFKHV